MRRVILHVGMYKTGGTSIQKSFTGYADAQLVYYGGGNGQTNHANTLFSIAGSRGADRPHLRHLTKQDRPALPEVESTLANQLASWLGGADARGLILSSAGVTHLTADELRRVAAYFARHDCQVEIYAYVRPPMGYMTSMFQQRVLDSAAMPFDVARNYPDYRRTIGKLDEAFGHEAVHLRLFDPAIFPERCVVRDFAAWVGLQLPDERFVRVNESLSLGTMALLYAYRQHGPSNATRRPDPKATRRLVTALAGLGDARLRFGATLLAPILAAQQEDIAWMETRLDGASLAEVPPSGGFVVRDEADLYAAARAAVARLGSKAKPLSQPASDLSPEDLAAIVASLLGDSGAEEAREKPTVRRAERDAAPAAERLRPAAIVADLARSGAAALQGVTVEQATAILRSAFATIRATAESAGGSIEVPGLGRVGSQPPARNHGPRAGRTAARKRVAG